MRIPYTNQVFRKEYFTFFEFKFLIAKYLLKIELLISFQMKLILQVSDNQYLVNNFGIK